jgi:hypothetical protein
VRRRAPALALAVLSLAAGGLAGCGGAPPDDLGARVDRVLIVSLPGVDWADVRGADLPHLDRFVRRAAIADMSTRVGRRPADLADAYLSMGAGTRAVAPAVDPTVALGPDDRFGGEPAADVVGRRLGDVPPGIAYLGVGPATDANADSAFGADVGALGHRLAAAGVDRAVVANGDTGEAALDHDTLPGDTYGRSAAALLMGRDGVVPGGEVGRGLLAADPTAPFGRRLDRSRVLRAVDGAWDGGGRSVVLVEASDLSRAAAYRSSAGAGPRREMRDRALADADALLGDLLTRVDPAHDAVIVLSPVAPPGQPFLGIAAVQAPGVDGGLLQSATTRRAGYVQLADVAPTVLSLLGAPTPDDMEGRSFAVGESGGSAAARTGRLADAADAAAFRDATMPVVVTTVIVGLVLLALAVTLRGRLGPRAPGVLAALAYGALGVVPGTYLVGAIGPVRANLLAQTLVILAIAAAVAAVCLRVERRRPGLGAVVAVGAIVALVAVDILVGAPLQLNTTFGYSVAVAGRFTGLGNLAFALFGSAAIVLAALIADRYGARGVRWAMALLAAVVVVEGLPMLGADVGGVLAMVPAFGVTALVLAGRRVRLRHLVGLAALAAGVLVVFALVDLARPAEVHTHLARLVDDALDGRWRPLGRNLGRRWRASLGDARVAGWLAVTALVAGTTAYVTAGRTAAGDRVRRLLSDRPTRAAAAGLAVLAVLGLVANDSSFAVPSTMLIVIGPAVMLRVLAGATAAPTPAKPTTPGPPPTSPTRVPEAVGA